MKKLLTATVCAVAMMATVPANAATVTVNPTVCPDGAADCYAVRLSGELVKGDDTKFLHTVRDAEVPRGKAIVHLDSPGGLVDPGIPIALAIRDYGWDTLVDTNKGCGSMCANIWLAGTVRYISPHGKLAFHTVSHRVRGKWVRNEQADAAMLKFYNDMGVSQKAGRVLIAADADDAIALTSDLAKSLDIKVLEWPRAKDAKTPETRGLQPGFIEKYMAKETPEPAVREPVERLRHVERERPRRMVRVAGGYGGRVCAFSVPMPYIEWITIRGRC